MRPVTELTALARWTWTSLTRRPVPTAGAVAAILLALCACTPPFNLDQPTTRALESGAAGSLSSSASFEVAGTYSEAGQAWTIDMQLTRPDKQHTTVNAAGVKLEAIVIADTAYFRGQQFLAQHMGTDPLSQSLVKAAGNAWWKGSAGSVPRLPELTNGSTFQTTLLGPAVTQRIDHVTVDGANAVDLSGPRADVYVAADPPYPLLRVHLKKGAVIDGISDGNLRFSNFGQDFQIATPTDVIDFSNLSTLPPVYTVVSVDTSRCGSPCVVTAVVKNLGGLSGAKAPSTVTFTMTDPASGRVIGTCQSPVTPDVGYNGTTTVSCTIGGSGGQPVNAAVVTATADNPGRA